MSRRSAIGKGLLALGLTVLVPALLLIAMFVLLLLDVYFGIGGFVVGVVLLLISVWWLWASRRGMV